MPGQSVQRIGDQGPDRVELGEGERVTPDGVSADQPLEIPARARCTAGRIAGAQMIVQLACQCTDSMELLRGHRGGSRERRFDVAHRCCIVHPAQHTDRSFDPIVDHSGVEVTVHRGHHGGHIEPGPGQRQQKVELSGDRIVGVVRGAVQANSEIPGRAAQSEYVILPVLDQSEVMTGEPVYGECAFDDGVRVHRGVRARGIVCGTRRAVGHGGSSVWRVHTTQREYRTGEKAAGDCW